jgi:uncharacterized membrane protein YhaH (DUF805 family)
MQRNLLDFYFGMKGRISRRDLWVLYYPVVICSFFLTSFIIKLLALSRSAMVVPVVIHVTAMVLSAVAVHVKRWHDIDRSGWFVLSGLIPVLGFIGNVIVCGFVPGTNGPNRFGDNPLDASRSPQT